MVSKKMEDDWWRQEKNVSDVVGKTKDLVQGAKGRIKK